MIRAQVGQHPNSEVQTIVTQPNATCLLRKSAQRVKCAFSTVLVRSYQCRVTALRSCSIQVPLSYYVALNLATALGAAGAALSIYLTNPLGGVSRLT
jgi:hypothetical protein